MSMYDGDRKDDLWDALVNFADNGGTLAEIMQVIADYVAAYKIYHYKEDR